MAEKDKFVEKEFQDLLSGLDVVLAEKGMLLYDAEIKFVDLETFLYDKEYLGLDIRLSPKQLDALEKLDNDSPDNPYVEGVFELGKGSGKDLLATLFFARRAYKLLCMGNPQKKFGMAGSETIDLLNVALSGDQAKKVFFVRFSNIIKHAGKKAFVQFGFDPSKDILKNQINFPKQIIAHSGHSEEQSQEGLNLYAAVMDEVSGFLPDKAQKLYDVISSSIHTRFPKVGKLLLLSYPRYADDFIEVKYKEGLKDPQTFTAIGPTWEWNPKITRESLDRDFKRNPEKAQAYYGCKPLESGIGFIRDLEKIEKIKDPNLRNPLDTLGRFDSWFKPSPYARNTYFCHIDLALGKIDEAGFQTSDVAALAMGHKEESGIIIIDLMKRYTAPATGKEVEFASIRQDIIDLKTRGFNIKKITIDGWQCFTGDTKLCLLDGTTPTMEELSKKTEPYWVWSYDKSNGLVPGLAKPARVTGRKAPILKVTLDNDEVIKCTPEHRFMLRNGEYKQAKDMVAGESLMPLYSRIDKKYLKGYLQVYNPLDQKYHFAHKLIAKSIFGLDKIEQGKIIHHKDYNKLNNDPKNLEVMLKVKHCALHANNNKNFEKYWSDNRQQALENCSKAGQKNKGISKSLCHNKKVGEAITQWHKNPENADIKEVISQKNSLAIKKLWEDPEYRKRQSESHTKFNHKVKSIEFYGYEDVYDIEVDKYHNFALQAGVIVHNSKDSMQILQRQGFEVELLAIDKGMAHWDTFKEVVITERVKTYGHFPGEIWGTQVDNVLIHELRHLVLVDGKKVDHLDISSKDISDCVCGVVSNAIAFEEAGFSFAKL